MTDKNDEIKKALTAVLTEESYVEEALQRGKPMSEKKTKNWALQLLESLMGNNY